MHIQLEAFEGPLDLLFHLITKNEIDIHDIPMVELTRQYLEVLRDMSPNMEDTSAFMVMAATLLEIKSRMLLPRPVSADAPQEDPREALVRQLIAYRHCQELAKVLRAQEAQGRRLFKGPEPALIEKPAPQPAEQWLDEVTLDGLWRVFAEVMQRQSLKVDTVRGQFSTVNRERFSITDKIKWIGHWLKENGTLRMSQLFAECASRSECIVTFLALLEMIRRRQAQVRQERVFAEIEVRAC